MAGDRCDMCQENEYAVSNVVRENGDTTWFCWTCFPYGMAQYLAGIGWSVEPPTAPEAVTDEVEEESAAAAETPRRRPRVVKVEAEAPAGPADPAGVETPPADPDDQRGADRLESGGRAGQKPGAPPAGA